LVSVSSISLGAPPNSPIAGGSQSREEFPGSELVVHPATGAIVGAAPANATTTGAPMVTIAIPKAKTARRAVNFVSAIVRFLSLSCVKLIPL